MATETLTNPTSEVKTTRPARWPELDGLRGVAILLVFCLHYIAESRSSDQGFGMTYHLAQAFRLGWSGVDLFFVLSGFLIGGILLDARHSSGYFKTFYVRRAHRILPIYYVWLALYAFVAFLLVRGNPVLLQRGADHALHTQILVHCLFLQNIFFPWQSDISHFGIGVAWSLAVEEQFYLIAPLLVRYLSPRRLTQVLIVCVVGAPILRAVLFAQLADGKYMDYVLMPCRADAFALGVLAAIAWRSGARTFITRHAASIKWAIAALAAGALAMLKWMPGPTPGTAVQAALQFSWFGVLFTLLLLLVLAEPQSILARVARWKFLREWGRVSYCIYLIHWAILAACHAVLLHSLPRITDGPGILTTLLAAALTWTVAQASYRYFEKPLIDRGHEYCYGEAPARLLAQPAERLA